MRTNKRECSRIDAHVGGQMRHRRLMAGITQEDVGKVLGISFQQVQKYENGTNRMSAGRLYVLANLLNVSVNDLFVGLDPMSQASRAVDDELRRVEQFAASREGMNLNLAYLDAPNARVRKLAIELLRLDVDRSDKNTAGSHGIRN
ncbi:MAG: helix-turn-helix transcriptional regulator [Proteobacteria bacterium]|nr:helix-turn-helix transcriptional regulator [Pseudomonadota bacterium]